MSAASRTFVAILLTVVASTACSIGKALQKEATRHLPKFSVDEKILQQYIYDRTWVIGLAADVVGGIVQTLAFAMAPVSILQPVSGVGLVGLGVYSHFYMKEMLHKTEWIAVAVAGVGTIGLGMSSSSGSDSQADAPPGFFRIIITLSVASYGINFLSKLRERQAKESKGLSKAVAALYGLQAGGCFGLSASVIRTGFLLASFKRWTWAPFGILCGIALSSTGFVLQTCGLKEGTAVVVCTCVAVTAMVVGVVVGIVGLGESMPSSSGAIVLRMLSWASILYGVVVLSGGAKLVRETIGILIQKIPTQYWHHIPPHVAVKIKNWALHEHGLPEVSSVHEQAD